MKGYGKDNWNGWEEFLNRWKKTKKRDGETIESECSVEGNEVCSNKVEIIDILKNHSYSNHSCIVVNYKMICWTTN